MGVEEESVLTEVVGVAPLQENPAGAATGGDTMPLAVESITKDTPLASVRRMISETIKKLIDEGKSPKDAAGQAYGMAEEKWGREIPRKR